MPYNGITFQSSTLSDTDARQYKLNAWATPRIPGLKASYRCAWVVRTAVIRRRFALCGLLGPADTRCLRQFEQTMQSPYVLMFVSRNCVATTMHSSLEKLEGPKEGYGIKSSLWTLPTF